MSETSVETPLLHRHTVSTITWPTEPHYGTPPLVDRRSPKPHLGPHPMRRQTDREQQLPTIARRHLAMKRTIDVIVSAVALVVFAPLMLCCAILVKTTSRGPVLFRQTRVGKGGKHFTILKFRSMRHGTHDEINADPVLWAEYVANDFKLPAGSCRITRVGRVLRKLSLDELPQLINVLRGEMSLVGIRPLLPSELVARPVRSQALYGCLAPGMTGLWQVEGRTTVTQHERVALDDRYVSQWRPLVDASILLRTPVAVASTQHAA